MDILFLLIPMSAALVLGIVGIFGWAVHAGQFDDLDLEAGRALVEERPVRLTKVKVPPVRRLNNPEHRPSS